MSLPKRDGVHGRYYLIHKPDTDPEVLEQADQCIQDVLDGTAEENHSGYPVVVRNQNGTPFLPSQLLERYLSKLPLKGFPYEEAVAFCDALRRLAGWKEIDHTLRQYIEKQVQERYFEVGEKEDDFYSLTRPVPCGRSCGRRMWMTACCALPAMWRSVIRCMEPAMNTITTEHYPRPGFPAPPRYGEAAENGRQRQIAKGHPAA